MSGNDQFGEGTVVDYKGEPYWIYEIKGSKVRLLPMDAVDFADGVIYNLGKVLEVSRDKIKIFNLDG